MKTRAPVKLFTHRPDRVYFVRLYGDNESSFIRDTVIPSNFAKGGYTYLLNVPPGRYVAVAAYRSQSHQLNNPPPPSSNSAVTLWFLTEYGTYFSEKIVKLTEVTVKSGSIAFMGEFVVDQSYGLGHGDEIQLHYYGLLAPEDKSRSSCFNFLIGRNHYKGSLHRVCQDEKACDQFLAKAKEHLKETGWSDAARKKRDFDGRLH